MASQGKNGGIGEGSNKAGATKENFFRKWLEIRPDPSTISAETMQVAEEIAWKEVLLKIHPTRDEEEKRADITLFLKTLFTQNFYGIHEVFPYGSVPLKTFLGDGDIDLTLLCEPDLKDYLADGIHQLLMLQQQNVDAEYRIKETKMIVARERKLVKCKVNNVSVDISFNELGGLSKLCFLEQIDRRVNKNHLFKLSVLLIKAWCHYEARILGGSHHLLATYALEALILFIFQLFGSSLNGPLAVLYRFFDYYAKFDWGNCSMSLDGPVRTSSLPNVVVTDPGNGGAELLLSGEDQSSCMDMFASSSYSSPQNRPTFFAAFLNIIDPLKADNNLGRSVSTRDNFLRIKSAFTYGARHLGRILLLPRESISDEIKMFFECTLTKYGCTGAQLQSLPPLPPLSLSSSDEEEEKEEESYKEEVTSTKLTEGSQLAMDVIDSITSRSRNEHIQMQAIEENADLLDLAGDYASSIRNFVHARCTIGFCATLPELSDLQPPSIAYQEMKWNWEAEAASMVQYIYADNTQLYGTGAYIPNMYSTSFWERSLDPAVVNHNQTSDELNTPGPSQKDHT